jgi:hypothetical protein
MVHPKEMIFQLFVGGRALPFFRAILSSGSLSSHTHITWEPRKKRGISTGTVPLTFQQ